MVRHLSLAFERAGTVRDRNVSIRSAVIAGWTGRDKVALEKHIAELEALGVKRPASTPVFYRVAAARLTTEDAIEAVGGASSGEAEFVLLRDDGRIWVGAGSDHTDREVEAYSVSVSKQICDKPIARHFRLLDEVAPHWDRLMLRSWIIEDGQRSIYQEETVSAMLSPSELMAGHADAATLPEGKLPEGTLMFCGTLVAHGGIRPASRFEFEIEDPVLGRHIRHGYAITVLPMAS